MFVLAVIEPTVNETSDYVLSTRSSTPTGSRLIEVKAVGDDSSRQVVAAFNQSQTHSHGSLAALSPSRKHSSNHLMNGKRPV